MKNKNSVEKHDFCVHLISFSGTVFFRSNYPKVVSRRSPRPIILFRLYKYER